MNGGWTDSVPTARARRHTSRNGRFGGAALVSVVVGLYLAFATLVAAEAAHVLHQRSTAASGKSNIQFSDDSVTPKYLVLMVLDGAPPNYLTVTSLPHVDALIQQGTQFSNAMSGILEAETPAGHATIATGSRPSGDGILGFDWGTGNNRYSLFNPDQMGALEQIIQDSHAPTIGGLYKQKYPGAKVVALSGHKYYAAAPLGGPDADAIIYYEGDPQGHYVPVAVPGHAPPQGVLTAPGVTMPTTQLKDGQENNLATRMALAVTRTMHPRIMLINYPEFDWPLGHIDGGMLDKQAVITDMTSFDDDLGKIEDLYRQEGILDQTLFVITADHGMMPISRFVPATVLNNALSQAGTTALDAAANSAEYVWLADPSKGQTVAQNIVNTRDVGIESAYYLSTDGGQAHYVAANRSDLSDSQEAANQYLLSSLLNGHQPTVVVVGKEGASFSDPKTNWKADHGGPTWQSEHVPLVISGPGIKSGQVVSDAAGLDDVAPTVLQDMGVEPTGMQGKVLTEALINPQQSDIQKRDAEVKLLAPVINTLAQQSTSNAAPSG
jgi:predicted AlkP superfamily pyrophosphatase or phosphodiesterase